MTKLYCCAEFEMAVECDDFCYFRAAKDAYRSITKDGWDIRNAQNDKQSASLEPLRHCPLLCEIKVYCHHIMLD